MDQSKRGDNAIAYYAKHTAQIEVRIVDGWSHVLGRIVYGWPRVLGRIVYGWPRVLRLRYV